MKRQIVIATSNPGKLQELRSLLADLPFDLRDLNSFGRIEPVAENGSTFMENASLKASGYARQTGLMTLADDSGLEVESLGGRPGVQSARYAGPAASDRERVHKLLSELDGVAWADRAARFVSAIAIADGGGAIINVSVGTCGGRIVEAPRGENGFGYDPVFVPDGFAETFAELPGEIKNRISHRGKSLKDAVAFLGSLTVPQRAG
jgi:XTP/dITP diphosphohydrolase